MKPLARLLVLLWAGLSRTAEVVYRLTLLLTMLTFVGLAAAAAIALLLRPELPERMTLQLSLPGMLPDMSGLGTVLSALTGAPQPALFDVVDALHSAAADPRVEAVMAEIGEGPFDLAQNQAIADALAEVRAAGKPTYAFSDSFGEMSPGYGAYHLAAAFDEIWLQPVGQLAATGIALETRFYGQLLERLGVRPLFGYREEFKTARHHLLFGGSTGPQAEMMQALAADLQARTSEEIARGRGQEPARLRQLLAAAPYSDREALAADLVDRLGYLDELTEQASDRHGPLVPVISYLRRIDRRHASQEAPGIGLVTIDGRIARGRGIGADLLAGRTAGAASIARDIQRLAGQGRIVAIILRVDSPGGSPAASETIHRAVTRARAHGIRVVVSMASTAGSGAYWLASAADLILAQAATLTGSIGVVGGKLDLGRLLAEAGVAAEQHEASAHAGMWSMSRGYRAAEQARRDALLDATYATLLERVASGRGLDASRVRDLAKGRVWTGHQAQALGLVDRLGGLEDAIVAAKALVGLPPEASIDLVRAEQITGLPSLPMLLGSIANQLGAWLRAELTEGRLWITA